MKTEMKMIAAILAVLAVALGGVYALDTAQAEEIDETQAIWPGPAYDEDHQYAQWSKDGAPRDAEWEPDAESSAVYWMDIYKGGAWFTVLDGTVFELDGNQETYRIKAEGIVDQNTGKFVWDNIQIDFYNFRGEYTLSNGQVMPVDGRNTVIDENAIAVETDIGTLYLNAIEVYIQLNKVSGGSSMGITVVTSIPVLVVEKIDVTGDYEYAYTYNGLEQTPIKELGGDNSDASTPYVHFNDCFDEYADYGIVWKYSGTTSETDTNKLKALNKVGAVGYDFENGYYYDANGDAVFPVMEAYTATLTPTGSKYIEGTITITWWIMPLGLEDVNFTIKDVAYDYDNEVVPTVANKDIVMKWTEPEDGPNGAKAHYLGFGASVPFYDVSYGVPDSFPNGKDLEYSTYVYYTKDDNTYLVYVEAQYNSDADEYEIVGDAYYRIVDGSAMAISGFSVENPAVDGYNSKTIEDKTYYPVLNCFNYYVTVPVYDEQGNPVYVQKMVDGEPVEVQLRDQYGRLMFTELEEELDEEGDPISGQYVMETVMDADIVYVKVQLNAETSKYEPVKPYKYVTIVGETVTDVTDKIGIEKPDVYSEIDTVPKEFEGDKYLPAYSNYKVVSIIKTTEIIQDKDVFGRPVFKDVLPADSQIYVPVSATVGEDVKDVYMKMDGESAIANAFYTISTVDGVMTATAITDVTISDAHVKNNDKPVVISTGDSAGTYKLAYDAAYVQVEKKEGSDVYTPVKSSGKYTLVTIFDGDIVNDKAGICELVVVNPSPAETDVITIGTGDNAKYYLPALTPKEVDVYLYDADGNIVQRHLLYITGDYAYYQKVDNEGKPVYDEATGMPVYDLDKPIMIDVTMTVPNYDDDSAPVYAYVVPETTEVPKYDVDSEPVTVTVPTLVPATDAQGKPVYEQKVNELELPVYKKYLYQQLKFETGQINGGEDRDNYVWMQKVNSDGTLKFDKNGNPVYDYTKPVYDFTSKAPVYVETNATGGFADGTTEYTYVSILESLGKVTVLGKTGVKPVVPELGQGETPFTIGSGETAKYYMKVTGYYDGDVAKSGKFYAYDSKSQPVYVQETEEKVFTQVGYPYEREVFDYTVRIVYNAGVAEFDTDAYAPAVYGKGEMPASASTTGSIDRGVYAPLYDKGGKLVIDKQTKQPKESNVRLFTWNYILVEQDGASYIVPTGVEYQPD
ncbi:MAG: hypothetical protein IKH98_00045 [Candidatus Methanomethylophilaceae archaeon]|nr:hypothetical protein [Candidatus Methanomethylophilaceae archaeon]